MCGGDIELTADKTFGTCEFCGNTMTLPKIDDDQRATAFNRGNHFRRIGEFDKALAVYERIVREDDTDAEAHWCCALCRFGIEYVEDPATYEWLPTCHRASFDSFLEDVDYKAAVEYSDGITKRQYMKDGAKIAEVQRGILATSQNAEPYDVFICYKESDANGERTRDSLMAQDIYYQLTEQGRRVFFARITLEDIVGAQYEPYIFAALNSARVMIVVGTKAEHLNAVWVKNEWSRFLAMMKKDHSKLLLPCYRDMDPYDMPEHLSVLQSYDMGKIGFIQDLTRGIAKVLDAQKKAELGKETVIIQQSATTNTDALLKRGYLALEDLDWDKADSFFEEVLNQDAECAQAYLGKALLARHLPSLQKLTEDLPPIESLKAQILRLEVDMQHAEEMASSNAIAGYLEYSEIYRLYTTCHPVYKSYVEACEQQYQAAERYWNTDRNMSRAQRFAKGEVVNILSAAMSSMFANFNKQINQAKVLEATQISLAEQEIADHFAAMDQQVYSMRNAAEQKRLQHFQNQNNILQSNALPNVLLQAAAEFEKLGDFRNSLELAQQCRQLAEQKTAAAEAKSKAAARAAADKAKRKKIIAAVVCTVMLLAFSIVLYNAIVLVPRKQYDQATALLNQGKYDEAIAAFTAMGDYQDAPIKILEAKYGKAEAYLAEEKFDEAAVLFKKIENFSDAAQRVYDVRYLQAEFYLAQNDYKTAIDILCNLGDYSDSAEKCYEIRYQYLTILLNGGDVPSALTQMHELLESEKYLYTVSQIYRDLVNQYLNAGDYENALYVYNRSPDYDTSSETYLELNYHAGTAALEKKNYSYAWVYFEKIPQYLDAYELAQESHYQYALLLLEKTDPAMAILELEQLGDYKNSDKLLLQGKYKYVKQYFSSTNEITYRYLKELKEKKYSDSAALFKELYAWKVTIVVNDKKDDKTTNMTSVSKYGNFCFHVSLSGGEPGQKVRLKYEGHFPDKYTVIKGEWDEDWSSGYSGSSWFYYNNPQYGATGTFTFKLYDDNGNLLAKKTVKITG